MSRVKLRHAIAVEAARLLLREEERDYVAARRRAARWLSRRRLDAEDLPTRAEIDSQLRDLAGLFATERTAAALRELRHVALDVGEAIANRDPRFAAEVVHGPVSVGSEITLAVADGEASEQHRRLAESGRGSVVVVDADEAGPVTLRFSAGRFPCRLSIDAALAESAEFPIDLDDLRTAVAVSEAVAEREAECVSGADDGADAFALFRMLLGRLEDVRLDPTRHPEGDALYHSLQVFELGREERPWDEEFLLACLLHDAGLAIEPRRKIEAVLETLGDVITERTASLIAELPLAREALRTGRVPKSLQRSEHGDDLLLLARCDVRGRVAGARTCELDEALAYVAGLEGAWDDA